MAACDHASIVPGGFERVAHPVFRDFSRPTFAGPTAEQRSNSTCEGGGESSTQRVAKPVVLDLDALETGCSICLSTLDQPVSLCGCGHSFCLACLQRWLLVSESCPLCKCEITVFVDARPQGVQQLFSRQDVSIEQPIPGLDLALRVQAALHPLISIERAQAQRSIPNDEGGSSHPKRPFCSTVTSTNSDADDGGLGGEPCVRPPPTLSQLLASLDSEIDGARQQVSQLASDPLGFTTAP